VTHGGENGEETIDLIPPDFKEWSFTQSQNTSSARYQLEALFPNIVTGKHVSEVPGFDRFHGQKGAFMNFFKRQTQTILKRVGLYHRLKTSCIHDLYRSVADRDWILARNRRLEFYRRLLPELRQADLIFDVGANDGLETDLSEALKTR
jgi:hypothetical protein